MGLSGILSDISELIVQNFGDRLRWIFVIYAWIKRSKNSHYSFKKNLKGKYIYIYVYSLL